MCFYLNKSTVIIIIIIMIIIISVTSVSPYLTDKGEHLHDQ